ncbi:hypothetical protein [Nitrosospira sp. Is2]|uniref:hypothetical protein n=1 Tax=Nitrosospira sp. Is2 TaxID=3080532 RepID=UPI0029546E40|nr:hypothetical protein [Nitrosospira sp. Is2]WON73971.1 hypothetical protein R5L00_00335 [Nitrosospira sp. Is2]
MVQEKSVHRPVEAVLEASHNDGNPELNRSETLRRLMEFYESDETANEEESEIDVINQLYDTTNSATKREE